MYLVIAEKPSVSRAIAEVIGAQEREDGYLQGTDCMVSWCFEKGSARTREAGNKLKPVHEVPEHLRRESVRPGGSETSFGERGLVIFRNHGSACGAPKRSRPEQHPSANRGLRQPR